MNEIAKIREALLLSQVEMAERLGLNQSTISRLERGELPIDKRTSLAVQALLTAHLPAPLPEDLASLIPSAVP